MIRIQSSQWDVELTDLRQNAPIPWLNILGGSHNAVNFTW